MRKYYFFSPLLFVIGQSISAQNVQGIVQQFMQSNIGESNIRAADVAEWEITDIVPSLNPEIQHVYTQQKHQGIPIENGRYKLTLKGGEITWFINQFVTNLEEKAQSFQTSLSPEAAIMKVVGAHDMATPAALNAQAKNSNSFVYDNSGISIEPITVDKVYIDIDGKHSLGWKVSIYQLDGQHWWNEIIDAGSGEVLFTDDWLISCNFEDPNHSKHNHNDVESYGPVMDHSAIPAA